MPRNRTAYYLTRFQIIAICEALNAQNQIRIAKAEAMREDRKLTTSRAIMQRRAQADADLVKSLVDGLGTASTQPTDRHCIFQMA